MQSPDIIGVEEVGDIETLMALANKLNLDSCGANPNYQAYLIESDDDTERDIDVGFLVKASRVNVVSVTQEGKNESYINPLNGQPEILNDRPPLVLRATINGPTATPFPVTVIVNHLRSLIDIDQDPGDGPRVREKRRKQGEFLAELVQSLQNENLVLVGDFNAFQFSDGFVDVIGTIRGSPAPADQVVLASSDLVDPNLSVLVDTLPAEQRYSFVFQGSAQTLDHVLLDPEMQERLSRFAYARNNADFPEAFGSDATRSERVSDHDMPVAYFNFPPPSADLSVTLADSPDPVLTNATLTYTLTLNNAGPDRVPVQ
jgi:predicted extracellular nuclease